MNGSVPPAAEPAADRVLEWRAWPLRDRPRAGALALVAVLVTALAAASLGGHLGFGILALIILMGSLNPFLSPTEFRLDGGGVTVHRWPTQRVRAWDDLHSCVVDRHGITLSPFVGRAWLEPYRGVRLLFDGNREVVIAHVRDHLGDEVRVRGLLPTDTASRRSTGADEHGGGVPPDPAARGSQR